MVVKAGGDCVAGLGYKALVNAFEAAWKKQFLDRMRSRGAESQRVEARLACNMLNRMTELGR